MLSAEQIEFCKKFSETRNRIVAYAHAFKDAKPARRKDGRTAPHNATILTNAAISRRAKNLMRNPEIMAYIAQLDAEKAAKLTSTVSGLSKDAIVADLVQAKEMALRQYKEDKLTTTLKLYCDISLRLSEFVPEAEKDDGAKERHLVALVLEQHRLNMHREIAERKRDSCEQVMISGEMVWVGPDYPLFAQMVEIEKKREPVSTSTVRVDHGGEQLASSESPLASSDYAMQPGPVAAAHKPGDRRLGMAEKEGDRISAQMQAAADNDWVNKRVRLNPQF